MWRILFVLMLVVSVAITLYGQVCEADDWPMYGRNLQHTFSNPASAITPQNVATLQPAWHFPTGDAVSASPTVVDGVVYIGAWDGFFYALDAHTGALRWQFPVDCDHTIVPIPPQCLGPDEFPPDRLFTDGGLITASAVVVQDTVYFAAGKTLYSVRAADGQLRWKRVLCGNPDDPDCAADANDPTKIFSSPALFEGTVFIGQTADGTDGYRGGFLALDAKTGETRWRFEVDPLFDAKGRVIGGQNRGCGNVWSSPAIDRAHRLVFFGTADCNQEPLPPYHQAVIALETDTGGLRWGFRPRETDPNACDFDFGASPTVFDLGPHRYVGIGSKDGTYYVLQRLTANPKGEVTWATNVVFGGMGGGFFGAAAFDGTRLFSATGVGDYNPPSFSVCDPADPRDTPIQEPSLHAFTAASGAVRWEQTENQSFAPTSLAAGVVLTGTVGLLAPPALQAYDARTGQLLASFPLPGSVNGGATPVGKRVFVGSGNSSDGTGSGVHAFTLP